MSQKIGRFRDVRIRLTKPLPHGTVKPAPELILQEDNEVVAENVFSNNPTTARRTLMLVVPYSEFPQAREVESATPANAYSWTHQGLCDVAEWVDMDSTPSPSESHKCI